MQLEMLMRTHPQSKGLAGTFFESMRPSTHSMSVECARGWWPLVRSAHYSEGRTMVSFVWLMQAGGALIAHGAEPGH